MTAREPIHVVVQGSPHDPRRAVAAPPGVVVHYAPPLHPDDLDVVDGLPVTSVSRTLVDLAEVLPREELVATFALARERGLLDMAAVEASYERVEWRPSLPMLRSVMDEFFE
jgi:hypothetical protein